MNAPPDRGLTELDALDAVLRMSRGEFSVERYAEALPLLDKAVEVNPAQQHFYTNRGLARIKTGMPNQGQADLQHAMQLGPDNGYTFRNMGIYHLDKGDHAEALRLLKRAKELDHTAHRIDELIASAERGG